MSLLKDLQKASRNESFFVVEDEDEDSGKDENLVNPDDVDDFDFPLPDALPTYSSQVVPAGFAPNQHSRALPPGVSMLGPKPLEPSVYKRWVCLYPCYIDVDKSIEEGRKISKSLAVKNPHGFRIAHVVQSLGLSVVYESHKTHPRDWSNPGRVRVEMKRNSMYVNPAIKTRKQLLHRVAALLPGLEKTLEIPKQLISPLTPLSEIQSIADEMRRVQLGGAGAASSPPRVTSGPSSPSASSSVATPEASASKKKGKKGRK